MPSPDAASPSGLASYVPMLVVIIIGISLLVLIMQAPAVRAGVDRFLGGVSPQRPADLTTTATDLDESTLDPSGEPLDSSGALPFPAFDPSIYGPEPSPPGLGDPAS